MYVCVYMCVYEYCCIAVILCSIFVLGIQLYHIKKYMVVCEHQIVGEMAFQS